VACANPYLESMHLRENPHVVMMSLLLPHPRSAYPTFGSLADHFYLQYCFSDLGGGF
jgi:hypothetical protein